MSHTPGPWRVIETNLLPHDGDHVADMSNDLMVISSFKLGDPLADANLISAAPDMLEVLQYAVRWHDQLSANDLAKMRKAIAKATAAAA